MNLYPRLKVTLASLYLRHSPLNIGRWRIIHHILPILREKGALMGERIVSCPYDFLYKADLGDWLGQYVYLTGVYEPPTARIIAHLLNKGDTFIDIGANSGFFTLLAARQVGSDGQVLSFEPVPAMSTRLKQNLTLNGFSHVKLFNVALSDTKGVLTLFEGPEGHKGISSLRKIENSIDQIQVKTIPLDELPDLPRRVNVVKIDVEGAEQKVLNGMTHLLERDKPSIVIEITDDYLSAFGHSAIGLATFLTSRGYRMYEIGESGLFPRKPEQAIEQEQFNALFTCQPIPEDLLALSNQT